MAAEAPLGVEAPQGGAPSESSCLLLSLPEQLLANIWPPERVAEGLCVCSKGLTRTLLAAPRMDLTGRGIGDRGCEALAVTLSTMTGLQELHLGNNEIGRAGADALGRALKPPTGLRTLVLGRNNQGSKGGIGAEGAKAIGPHLPSSLRHLDLS
jgi:hypothetical protein